MNFIQHTKVHSFFLTFSFIAMLSLKNVLVLNSLTTGASGIGLVVLSGFIASLFGVSETQGFISVGVFFLICAALQFWISRQEPIRANGVLLVTVLDVAWVIVSLVIVLGQMFSMTTIGYLLTIGVAVWVAAMAFLQIQGLRHAVK